jgi:uncharacterized protein YcaQ
MLPNPPAPPQDDGAARVLGPLDALLWDRALVRVAFDFDYVWEVYKPEHQRIGGYYVCPVLADGQLVARVEARRDGRLLRVDRWWGALEPARMNAAMERLATQNGCDSVALPSAPCAAP